MVWLKSAYYPIIMLCLQQVASFEIELLKGYKQTSSATASLEELCIQLEDILKLAYWEVRFFFYCFKELLNFEKNLFDIKDIWRVF